MGYKISIVSFFLFICSHFLFAQNEWVNPIEKQGRLGSPLVETSPFVLNDRLYLLENHQRFWDFPGAKPGDYFHEDEIRIRDIGTGKLVSVPLKNHGFGTILTWEGSVYVFAGDYGKDKPWRQMTEITMISSKDLINWSAPQTILKASGDEFFFNTAVCRGKDSFVLLYETNDSRWKPFTFRYMASKDLVNWEHIPNAYYGKEKYVGGPALYYEADWYYTLYLEALEPGYETRITRSRDLVHWEDAPEGRPFITFDPGHKNIPLIDPNIRENNASDVELVYFKGKTILYFTGSDQTTGGDLQWATYNGTPKELFEHFFTKSNNDKSKFSTNSKDNKWQLPDTIKFKPSPQQLAFQERQLGAFVHFGPATYIQSDMLAVPPSEVFYPSQLNARQWARTAKSFGAKYIVLTAKHHNGFCLWPTETTEYSVRNSPWKEGKGDVVAEFVTACRENELEIGLYVSGGDKHFGCSSTPDPQGERKLVGDIHGYFPEFMEQLRELLTNYGKISYLWFDGAYDPFGWDVKDSESLEPMGMAYGDAIHAMAKALQPEALIMGGTRPDVRWSGSEQGWAAYPLWNVVQPGQGFDHWVGPQNAGWIPAEANIHTRNQWFWTPDSDTTLRDIPYMMKAYQESIGRGANLLVNMTPDTCGLIPAAEVKLLNEWGEQLQNTFANPLGRWHSNIPSPENIFLIQLPERKAVNLVMLEEDLQEGQFIREYELEAKIENRWHSIASGQSIGRKRIQSFNTVETDQVRLSVKGEENQLKLKNFRVYFQNE